MCNLFLKYTLTAVFACMLLSCSQEEHVYFYDDVDFSGPLCRHGGQQVRDGSDIVCSCPPYRTGLLCEQTALTCEDNPCRHGSCSNATQIKGYVCTCEQGYTGVNCDININECSVSPAPCLNGGQCQDRLNGYTCSCPQGFTGSNCQTQVQRCEPNTCGHGTCTNTANSYTCTCHPGYEGDHCGININECTQNNVTCSGHGVCVDGINSYTCSCIEGYTGADCSVPPPPAPFNFGGIVVLPQPSNNIQIPDTVSTVKLTNDAVFSTNRPPFQTAAVYTWDKNVLLNGLSLTLTSYDGYGLNYSGTVSGEGQLYVSSVQAMGTPSCPHSYSPRPLVISGATSNTYKGPTIFMRGVIALNKSHGATAIPGQLTFQNQGFNDRILWMRNNQISDNADLFFNSTAGTLDLNGYQERINNLTMAQGAVFKMNGENTSPGVLIVKTLVYGGRKYRAGTYTSVNHFGLPIQGLGEIQVLETAP